MCAFCKPANFSTAGRSAVAWDAIDLTRDTRSKRNGEAEWRLSTPADDLRLRDVVDGRTRSRHHDYRPGPLAPRTHWEQLYFPLLDSDRSQVARGRRRRASLEFVRSRRHRISLGPRFIRIAQGRRAGAPEPRPRQGLFALERDCYRGPFDAMRAGPFEGDETP